MDACRDKSAPWHKPTTNCVSSWPSTSPDTTTSTAAGDTSPEPVKVEAPSMAQQPAPASSALQANTPALARSKAISDAAG
jgi:hypothetical protein